MKAQVSMEYMYYIGIMLVILAVVSYASLSAYSDAYLENSIREARIMASTVAQEINTAVEIGDGYSHSFYMPYMFSSGANYSVNTSGMAVRIAWNNRTYLLPTIAPDVTGTVGKGLNTIKNSNGVIEFV